MDSYVVHPTSYIPTSMPLDGNRNWNVPKVFELTRMLLRSLSFLPKISSIHTSRVGILESNTDGHVLILSICYGSWHIEFGTAQVISLNLILL